MRETSRQVLSFCPSVWQNQETMQGTERLYMVCRVMGAFVLKRWCRYLESEVFILSCCFCNLRYSLGSGFLLSLPPLPPPFFFPSRSKIWVERGGKGLFTFNVCEMMHMIGSLVLQNWALNSLVIYFPWFNWLLGSYVWFSSFFVLLFSALLFPLVFSHICASKFYRLATVLSIFFFILFSFFSLSLPHLRYSLPDHAALLLLSLVPGFQLY